MNRVFHFFMEISPLAVMIYWRARDQKRKKLAEPVFYYYTSRRGIFRPIDSYICIEKRRVDFHEATSHRACVRLWGCEGNGTYRGFI
ncbi:hypothetical protein C2W59_01752 [Bacillus pumilus]|nr:hypothetical protein C2W59_01752 [Bacillus pumilus]